MPGRAVRCITELALLVERYSLGLPRSRAMKASSASSRPRRPLWQWVLMYPTLAVAIVGALPQYQEWVSALSMGVPLGSNVRELQEQDDAWKGNLDCLAHIDHIRPQSATTYGIDLLSCPSGDILVTVTPTQTPSKQVSRWIITRTLFREMAAVPWISSAFAQTVVPRNATPEAESVIDIRKEGNQVIRRLKLSNGSCLDQIIDTFTGRHLRDQVAPCTRFSGR